MFKLKSLTKEQIYREILERTNYDTLIDYIRHNKEMQIKMKGFRLTKKSCPKEKLIKIIMDTSTTNAMIESYILKLWDKEVVFEKAKMSKISTKKEVETFVNSDRFKGDWFKAATILMAHDKKILNGLGEEYYGRYLEEKLQIKEKTNNKEEENLDMKNNKNSLEEKTANTIEGEICTPAENVLDLPVSEFIKLYEKYKSKCETLAIENEAKAKELMGFKSELKQAQVSLKEKDKAYTEVNERINKLENEHKKSMKGIEDLIKSNSGNVNKQLKDIEGQSSRLNESFKKVEVTLTENSSDIGKESLKQEIEKMLEQNFKAMVKELSRELSQQRVLIEREVKEKEVCSSIEEKVEEVGMIKTEDKGKSNMVFDAEAEAMLEELKMITKGK